MIGILYHRGMVFKGGFKSCHSILMLGALRILLSLDIARPALLPFNIYVPNKLIGRMIITLRGKKLVLYLA